MPAHRLTVAEWAAAFDMRLNEIYYITLEDIGQTPEDMFERWGEDAPEVAVDLYGKKYGLRKKS